MPRLSKGPLDALGRRLTSLRLSVTDRCNLRCHYCMPEESYAWLPRADLLSHEEMARLVDAFTDVGVRDIHVTGGEPLLRRDLEVLVRYLADKPALHDVALTTNGTLLAEHAAGLRQAGLHRVTVSLDTLRPERFERLARRPKLPSVLAGIEAARRAGFAAIGLNMVVMRGHNEDEIADVLELGRRLGAEVRFIEYMDAGGATRWRAGEVVSRAEILAAVATRFGPVTGLARDEPAPAERFTLGDGTRFGVIASVTAPFCRGCDRARLTADGRLYLCLYAREGVDLRAPLRAGASRADLAAVIDRAWSDRDARGAELRAERGGRLPLLTVPELRADLHLEMHVRGG